MQPSSTTIRSARCFARWVRIQGTDREGSTGIRNAREWPEHEHRSVDIKVRLRSGVQHGFSGIVVGVTYGQCDQRLSGLLLREQEPCRVGPSEEIGLDQILGLRDPVYQHLMCGSHGAIDRAIVCSLAQVAGDGRERQRRGALVLLGRFVSRRELSLRRIRRWIEPLDVVELLEDRVFQTIVAA